MDTKESCINTLLTWIYLYLLGFLLRSIIINVNADDNNNTKNVINLKMVTIQCKLCINCQKTATKVTITIAIIAKFHDDINPIE
jgi:hypothetical protein